MEVPWYMLPDPLTDRRRAATALVIGLLVQAVAVGAIGFAEADTDASDAGDVPAGFGVPAPRVGDRGMYSIVQIDADGDRVGDWEPVQGFVWEEPRTARDQEGRRVRTNEVVIDTRTSPHRGYEDDVFRKERSRLSFDAVTDRLVAVSRIEEAQQVDDDGDVEDSRQRVTYYDIPHVFHLCGLVHPLQGETPAPDGPVHLFKDCNLPTREESADGSGVRFRWVSGDDVSSGGGWAGEELAFEPNGSRTVDGHRLVRYTWEDPRPPRRMGERIDVVFRDNVPYPVEIRIDPVFPDSGTTVLRLSSWTRGDAAVAGPDDAVDPAPAPDVRLGPWTRYGPPVEDLDHTFPLGEAFRAARDNPRNRSLARFLDEHPDAYVHRANLRELKQDGPAEHPTHWDWAWQFTVAEGSDALDVWVARRLSADDADPPETPDTGVDPATYDFDYRPDGSPAISPEDALPDRVPTVASIMERWEAYRWDDDVDANAWSFYIDCPYGGRHDCEEVRLILRAGHSSSTYTQSPTRNDVRESTLSTLKVAPDGRTVALERSLRRTEYNDTESPLGEEGEPSGNASGPTSFGAPFTAGGASAIPWTPPSAGTAATVGLVAAVTALLYWAWPALKTLPLAPFHTRIGPDDVLDHEERRRIMEMLRDTPGAHLSELRRRTGLGEGTVRHHLRKLVDTGHVVEHGDEGYTCFYPTGAVDREVMAAIPKIRGESARRILSAVGASPGRSAKEIAEATGLSTSTVNYHLQRLRESGLIRARRDGRSLRLEATELGAAALGYVRAG